MGRKIDFNSRWAGSKTTTYPSKTQTDKGLGFLGTEPPDIDLHDALFQELDVKAEWLFRQIWDACHRFAVEVVTEEGNDYTHSLAEAMSQAVLQQNRASLSRDGIVTLASDQDAVAGTDDHKAITPRALAAAFLERMLWENLKGKPETATRWPRYDEVTNRPSFGSAAWKDAKEFEGYGKVSELRAQLGDAAFVGIFDSGTADNIPWGKSLVASSGALAAVNSSISKIGKTNAIGDSSGNLNFDRLNKPGFLSSSHDEGDGAVLSAKDNTRLRLLGGWIDHYGQGDSAVFTVSPAGKLDRGIVPVERLLGILPMSMGGTGRGDGKIGGHTIYVNNGSEGGLRFISAPGKDESSNKIFAGQDNGDDINRPGNVNADVWFGFSIASTYTGKVSLIHNARTGDTRQRGDLILGESNPGTRSVKSKGGDLHLEAGAGDVLALLSGNKLQHRNASGGVRTEWEDGVLKVGIVPVERLQGAGSAVGINVAMADFKAAELSYGMELARIGHVKALMDYLDYWWGNVKDFGVADHGNWEDIEWDARKLATISCVRAVKDKVVDLYNTAVTDMRWVKVFSDTMRSGESYGIRNGEVISSLRIEGQVDGNNDDIVVSVLQFRVNGQWRVAGN